MANRTKSDILKKELLGALEKSLGIVTTACKACQVARSTFYDWYNNDLDFKASVDDVGEVSLDFAESKLLEQISANNSTATIFYLKTKGKKRGYVERSEVVNRVDIETELQELTDAQLYERLNELRNAVKN